MSGHDELVIMRLENPGERKSQRPERSNKPSFNPGRFCVLLDDAIHSGVHKVAEKIGVDDKKAKKMLAYRVMFGASVLSAGAYYPDQKQMLERLLLQTLLVVPSAMVTISAIDRVPTKEGVINYLEVVVKALRFGLLGGGIFNLMGGLANNLAESLSSGISYISLSIGFYLVSSGNGMFKKLNDLIKEWLDRLTEGLDAPKSELPNTIPIK